MKLIIWSSRADNEEISDLMLETSREKSSPETQVFAGGADDLPQEPVQTTKESGSYFTMPHQMHEYLIRANKLN